MSENDEDLPLTSDDINAIIRMLMKIDATLEEIREWLLDDGEEEAES